ncbi:MAG: helix-turn-helix domain-containing protein [Pirellulaceae bacterium]|nr:helix-turn-helix domain-containing protein [Pirellulaceae bacterium]
METVNNGLSRSENAGPVLAGCSVLPPMIAEPAPAPEQKPNRKRKGSRLTSDRFAVLNGFVDCSLAGLSRSELATWLILYRDTRNGTAATSQGVIARRAGLSVRSVGKAVRRLIAAGLLVVVFQGGLNRGPSRLRVEPLRNQRSEVLRKKRVWD